MGNRVPHWFEFQCAPLKEPWGRPGCCSAKSSEQCTACIMARRALLGASRKAKEVFPWHREEAAPSGSLCLKSVPYTTHPHPLTSSSAPAGRVPSLFIPNLLPLLHLPRGRKTLSLAPPAAACDVNRKPRAWGHHPPACSQEKPARKGLLGSWLHVGPRPPTCESIPNCLSL